jgi:alpha-1,3/alpha-1,6-mannosyltransferase
LYQFPRRSYPKQKQKYRDKTKDERMADHEGHPPAKPRPKTKPANIIFIHPDLGIGGAERLIIDAALALQARGHRVTIYTSHRDKSHCFEEARDGTLDVRVRGNTIFPSLVLGRFHLIMAILRQVHLTVSVLSELGSRNERKSIKLSRLAKAVDAVKQIHHQEQAHGEDKKREEGDEDDDIDDFEDDIFIVDQLPACVPILKTWGSRYARIVDSSSSSSNNTPTTTRRRGKQRILFYCHFPDQLLARRNEGSAAMRLVKMLYRYPLDWFEGWATSGADKVVANSNFTRGIVKEVFGPTKLGDIQVVYPCVDTADTPKIARKEDGKSYQTRLNEQTITTGELWGGKKILLSINRYERKKGIGLAIRAYHGLGKELREGTRLVIAG